LGVLFEDAAAAAAAAAIILEAVGEEGSSPLLLWLSNLWSGVVSLTLPGRRVLIVDKEGGLWDWGFNLIELGGPKTWLQFMALLHLDSTPVVILSPSEEGRHSNI